MERKGERKEEDDCGAEGGRDRGDDAPVLFSERECATNEQSTLFPLKAGKQESATHFYQDASIVRAFV